MNYKWLVLSRRTLVIVVAVLTVAATIAGLVVWTRGRAPSAARLLPAADAYVYIDLRPLRAAGLFKTPPANLDADYSQFIRETGFQFERDLDEAAFAVHLPSAREAATSKAPPETRFSEVFAGRFDGNKVAAYLRKAAASSKPYGETVIYSIPLPGRTLRVAVLGKAMIAASNAESDLPIEEIINRSGRTFAGRGPELLRRHYRDVPLASVAWMVARTAPAGQQGNANIPMPGGFQMFFPSDAVIVAGVRYLGSVQLRAAAFTRSQEDAQRVSDQLNAFVALVRTIELGAQGDSAPDPELKAFFDSIRVSQLQDRAELEATIPDGFVKKMLSEAPVISAAPQPEKKADTRSRRTVRRHKK